MTAFTSARLTALGALTVAAGALLVAPAQAQNHPISGQQRATAQEVSQRGVPVADLAPNAPDVYVVKRGDTLWGISGLYLKSAWRWPELWGMNMQTLPNPHLIYPGQTLYLDKDGGYARLRTTAPGSGSGSSGTVRVSPSTRSDSLSSTALPTLKPHLIEPFLVEPVVVDASVLQRAPRVIATQEERVLMASGDRAYVRGDAATPLTMEPGEPRQFRVFRDAVALKDPQTGEVLGYEAQYLGKAELVRGESFEKSSNGKGGVQTDYVPATVDLTGAKEEIRAGDRLLPAPAREFISYVPRAPRDGTEARVVSIYGSSAAGVSAGSAGQNQVVAINLGTRNGIEAGHVMRLMTKGDVIKDKTDPKLPMIKLPSESNGLAMVFRTFDRVSYALILEIRTGVRVGDRLVSPQE